MPKTPSGLTEEEANKLSIATQKQIAGTMPKANELVKLSIGEGAYKYGIQQGNTVNWMDTGEFWPKDGWQGRTIGSWVGSGTAGILGQLGNPSARELNAADYHAQQFSEKTLSSGDFMNLFNTASQQPLGSPISPVVPDKIAPENSITGIQSVFGSQWTPSPAFTPELQARGIFGAVRIKGTNEVYTLGTGGTKETAESFLQKFGTSDQSGIVGEISKEQAIKLGITDTGQTAVAPGTPGAITSGGLANETPIDLDGGETKDTNVYTADTFKGWMEEYLAQQESLKTQGEKDAEEKVDDITTQLEGLLKEGTDKGAIQAAEEEKRQIEDQQKLVDDANAEVSMKMAEINSLTASYNLENQIVEGKPITLGRQQGQESQNYKMYLAQKNTLTADAGLLTAKALALQGKLDSAQNAADRATDLKWSAYETKVNNGMALLNLLEGKLDKKEQVRVDAMKVYYDTVGTQIADQKAREKMENTAKLNLITKYKLSGGLDKTIAELTAEAQTTATYRKEVKTTGGGGTTTSTGDPLFITNDGEEIDITTVAGIKRTIELGNEMNEPVSRADMESTLDNETKLTKSTINSLLDEAFRVEEESITKKVFNNLKKLKERGISREQAREQILIANELTETTQLVEDLLNNVYGQEKVGKVKKFFGLGA